MNGPRSLSTSTAALAAALALALVLTPVAGLPVAAPAPPAGPAPSTARAPTAVSGTGAAAAADHLPAAVRDPVRSERNTTAYLALEEPTETRRFGMVTLDVGGAVASDSAGSHSTYEATRLQSAFAAAGDNRSRRQLVVERAADRIDARIATLEERERRALAKYNAGAISTETYLRELAAVARAAGSLRAAVDLLHTYSAAVGGPVSERRIATQKARLLPLDGPVRDRVASTMRGEESPVRVYVETSSEGVVLAAIDRGPFSQEYLREAYVPSAWNPDGTDQFEQEGEKLEVASQRAAELYPWAFENQGGTSIGTFTGEPFLYNAGVYSVRVGHPHGTSRTYDLMTFIDGATRDVFREVQYKDLSAIPTVAAGSNVSEGLNVSVERTRTGGPMHVTVTNATTGEPVRAEVRVDGERVGTTDVNGQRWVIVSGPTATVTATQGNASVSITVFSDGAPTG